MAADPAVAQSLPRVAEDAVFVPEEDVGGAPNVVVDGARLPETVLSLSHWPGSGTPDALRADTSAEIVTRYLDADPRGPEVGTITINHYDEDGLFGIWLLMERPPPGSPERAMAVAAAEAGDFGTWTDPWAARVAIAAMRMAERGTTPFPEVGRALAGAEGGDPAGRLYLALLPRTRRLLTDPERFRMLWAPDWERITADTRLLDAGDATLADDETTGVAVLRTPRPLHPMAVHPRTPRMRILTVLPDGTLWLTHRYETWVDYVSRPLPPRVDLGPLAGRLQGAEENPGRWLFEGVQMITPRLYLAGPRGTPAPSSVAPERLLAELAAALETERVA